jgi:RNA polymerase sigma-70 factor, ECF subfamily
MAAAHLGKSDLALIKEFQKGDQASFEELISRYSDKAFHLASRMCRNQEDAEEVLQDVFTTVFRKIDGFEGKSSFSSWLYRVTVNSALMKLRKRRTDRTVSMEDALPHEDHSPLLASQDLQSGEDETLRLQIAQALEQAISRLPDEYRPVYVLRDIDGLTSKEVGRLLGISIPAVKSRLHRSRIMLRHKLNRFYHDYRDGEPIQQPLSAANSPS